MTHCCNVARISCFAIRLHIVCLLTGPCLRLSSCQSSGVLWKAHGQLALSTKAQGSWFPLGWPLRAWEGMGARRGGHGWGFDAKMIRHTWHYTQRCGGGGRRQPERLFDLNATRAVLMKAKVNVQTTAVVAIFWYRLMRAWGHWRKGDCDLTMSYR